MVRPVIPGRPLGLAIFATMLLASTPARAQVVTPPDASKTRGHRIPDVAVVTDDSTTFHLADLAGKPIIINPVFTRCPNACPAITTSLRDALAEIGAPEVGYHVLTISFDPADGPAELRAYRERLALPAGWIVATATPANVAELLDALDFRTVAIDGGGFAHPNVIAIVTPALAISGYVHGLAYAPGEVRRGLEGAVRDASLVEHYKPVLIGVGVLSVLVMAGVLVATRKRAAPPHGA
jgi:protein SCO1/2